MVLLKLFFHLLNSTCKNIVLLTKKKQSNISFCTHAPSNTSWFFCFTTPFHPLCLPPLTFPPFHHSWLYNFEWKKASNSMYFSTSLDALFTCSTVGDTTTTTLLQCNFPHTEFGNFNQFLLCFRKTFPIRCILLLNCFFKTEPNQSNKQRTKRAHRHRHRHTWIRPWAKNNISNGIKGGRTHFFRVHWNWISWC